MHYDAFWAIMMHYDAFGQLWAHCDAFEHILTHFGQLWRIRAHYDAFGQLWAHCDAFWAIMTHSATLGRILGNYDAFGHIRTSIMMHYDAFGQLWGIWRIMATHLDTIKLSLINKHNLRPQSFKQNPRTVVTEPPTGQGGELTKTFSNSQKKILPGVSLASAHFRALLTKTFKGCLAVSINPLSLCREQNCWHTVTCSRVQPAESTHARTSGCLSAEQVPSTAPLNAADRYVWRIICAGRGA